MLSQEEVTRFTENITATSDRELLTMYRITLSHALNFIAEHGQMLNYNTRIERDCITMELQSPGRGSKFNRATCICLVDIAILSDTAKEETRKEGEK